MQPGTMLKMGLIMILLSLPGLAWQYEKAGPRAEVSSYEKQLEQWRASRIEELAGEDGWLSLIGLFWLHPGGNKFGSNRTNDIVLPKNRAPGYAGSLWLNDGVVRLQVAPGVGLTSNGVRARNLRLRSDADGGQTVLRLGSLKMFIIKRGDRLGLRVKDARNPARYRFAGIEHFPVAPMWRVEATFEPYDPPRQIPIVNVLGMVEQMPAPGALVFTVGETSYRLEPVLEKGEKHLFIIFADKTTGSETYGGGRYLYADPPGADGKVTLDFNLAHNPPCAFTRFATCPLPPRQNRLPIRVEAGEKKYAGSEH